MIAASVNTRTLLMRIFEGWHAENFSGRPQGDAFEVFASELERYSKPRYAG
jgi:hypothetical protein